MRAIFGLVLIVGMALAGAAVYMIQGYVGQTEAALQEARDLNGKAGKLVTVLVFGKDMRYGQELTKEDVAVVYWPEKALPKTIFQDPELLFPENAPGPRYLLRNIEAFEPVLSSRVTEPGEPASLTAKLDPGMRAFAIRISVATGVSDFVKPDDLIDIYWNGKISGELRTKVIEASIKVIAVDSAFNEDQVSAGSAKSITVAVSPEQVARLTQAQATGDLSMSLVGIDATEVTGAIEVNTNDVLGIEEAAPVVEAPTVEKKICKRKERKGTEVIETIIPCSD